jgi:hypothetical protein
MKFRLIALLGGIMYVIISSIKTALSFFGTFEFMIYLTIFLLFSIAVGSSIYLYRREIYG